MESTHPTSPTSRTVHLVIACSLALLALVCHLPALQGEFLSFDDALFIKNNPNVTQGITLHSLAWCFSLDTPTGWSPLAWVSYLIDAQLFGINPMAFHAVNLVLHAMGCALLFMLLTAMTCRLVPAALAAALLAAHPQHVESVAWIAERRDVLYMCMGLLTLMAYRRYALRPSARRYVWVLLLFMLGLMSKPMLITLPALMLLLDYWPLRRESSLDPRRWSRLILEKLPMFAMSAVAASLTMLIQKRIGAVYDPLDMPLIMRLLNVPVACATYLWRTIWPVNLVFFYPHPGYPTTGELIGSAALLVVISCLAWRKRKEQPWLIVGWLWYLIALIPVIGITQAGGQRTADRYTYLPMIGIYVAFAWTLVAWRPRMGKWFHPVVAACVLAIAIFSALSWVQTGYWRSNARLYGHALDVSDRNYVAHNNLGIMLMQRQAPGDDQLALEHFQTASEIRPNLSLHHRNLGQVLLRMNRPLEAVNPLVRATQLKKDDPAAHYFLAIALYRTGKLDEAIKCMQWAIKCKEDVGEEHYELGFFYEEKGELDKAAKEYARALELNSNDAGAKRHLEDVRKKLKALVPVE